MSKEAIVCGVQQVGVGIPEIVEAYNWYIKAFGCDVLVVDDDGVAERMLPYTGGKPRPRRAIIACNLRGGAGLEVWQPKDNNITFPAQPAKLGDLGISVCKIKSPDVHAAYEHISKVEGAKLLTEVIDSPSGRRHFYLEDPYGNIFEVVEDDYVLCDLKGYTMGGVDGAVTGSTDIDRSLKFYGELFGFDKVLSDETGVFEDFRNLPGGEGRFRRVLVTRSKPFEGPLSRLYGTAHIEFVQALDREPVKIFEGRMWGDPGFIQICFDIRNLDEMRKKLQAIGTDFVCDSGTDFQMESSDGRFTYIEDPDGALIEMVETYKIPVAKKLGIYLDLASKDDHKSLPGLLLKALRFLRVKSIM